MANLYSKKDAEGMGNGKLELLARCCAHGKFDLYSLSMPNLSVWCDRTPKWRPFVCSSCRRAADLCCTLTGAIWDHDHPTH